MSNRDNLIMVIMVIAIFGFIIALIAMSNSGIAGANGTNGTNGTNGYNGKDFNSTTPYIILFNGTQGIQGLQGLQGVQGIIGLTGNNGLDFNVSGTIFLFNGTNGTNGIGFNMSYPYVYVYNGTNGAIYNQSLNTTDSVNFVNLHLSGYLDKTASVIPSNPSANTLRMFVQTINGFELYYYLDSGGVLRLSTDQVVVVRNVDTGTIIKGSAVYAYGSIGTITTVKRALANSLSTMPCIGIAIENISHNAVGRIIQVGLLSNVNTSSYSEGNVLYVSNSVAGELTSVLPVTPNLIQSMGTILVSSSTLGTMQVIARSVQGNEYGTIQNSFSIGDGVTSGNRTLTFNGVSKGYVTWNGTTFTFTGLTLVNGTNGTNGINGNSYNQNLNTTANPTFGNLILQQIGTYAQQWELRVNYNGNDRLFYLYDRTNSKLAFSVTDNTLLTNFYGGVISSGSIISNGGLFKSVGTYSSIAFDETSWSGAESYFQTGLQTNLYGGGNYMGLSLPTGKGFFINSGGTSTFILDPSGNLAIIGTLTEKYVSGDYGALWASISLPTGVNGMQFTAYNSNAGVLGSRLYIYSNSAWHYITIT